MMPFHIASGEEVDEMTSDSGRRTMETGSARERFRRNTPTGIIELAVDHRFGERGKHLLGSERLRRTAKHGGDEATLLDGSFPGFRQ